MAHGYRYSTTTFITSQELNCRAECCLSESFALRRDPARISAAIDTHMGVSVVERPALKLLRCGDLSSQVSWRCGRWRPLDYTLSVTLPLPLDWRSGTNMAWYRKNAEQALFQRNLTPAQWSSVSLVLLLLGSTMCNTRMAARSIPTTISRTVRCASPAAMATGDTSLPASTDNHSLSVISECRWACRHAVMPTRSRRFEVEQEARERWPIWPYIA